MKEINSRGDLVIVTNHTHDFQILRSLWEKGSHLGTFFCGCKGPADLPESVINGCKRAMDYRNKPTIIYFRPTSTDYWTTDGGNNIKRMYLEAFSAHHYYHEKLVVICVLPEEKAHDLLNALSQPHRGRKFPYSIGIDLKLVGTPKNLAEIINGR